MTEQKRLTNVAQLYVIYPILEKIPYITFIKQHIKLPNTTKPISLVSITLSNYSGSPLNKEESQQKIVFSKLNYKEPEKGFQEVSIKQLDSISELQIKQLRYLIRDLVNTVMKEYAKETAPERNDTFNLLTYIFQNITRLVEEEIIC